MSKFIYVLFALFILSSCNKVDNVKKKLEGEWNVIEYRYRNFESLVYVYDCSGTISFVDNEGSKCDYNLLIDYQDAGVSKQKYESGFFEFENDQYFTLNRLDSNDTYSIFEDGRIIALTKSDLKVAMIDELGEHLFIFER